MDNKKSSNRKRDLGGAVRMDDCGTVNIIDCNFKDNFGKGFTGVNNKEVNIIRTQFTNNERALLEKIKAEHAEELGRLFESFKAENVSQESQITKFKESKVYSAISKTKEYTPLLKDIFSLMKMLKELFGY